MKDVKSKSVIGLMLIISFFLFSSVGVSGRIGMGLSRYVVDGLMGQNDIDQFQVGRVFNTGNETFSVSFFIEQTLGIGSLGLRMISETMTIEPDSSSVINIEVDTHGTDVGDYEFIVEIKVSSLSDMGNGNPILPGGEIEGAIKVQGFDPIPSTPPPPPFTPPFTPPPFTPPVTLPPENITEVIQEMNYTLSVIIFGEGDVNIAPGTYECVNGTDVFIVITPSNGWKLDMFMIDESIIFVDYYVIRMNANHTVQVRFIEKPIEELPVDESPDETTDETTDDETTDDETTDETTDDETTDDETTDEEPDETTDEEHETTDEEPDETTDEEPDERTFPLYLKIAIIIGIFAVLALIYLKYTG